MADDLTLQDVVNRMLNGFAQLNGRMDRVETGVKGIKEELRRINDRLTAIENILWRHRKSSVSRSRSRAGIAAIDRPAKDIGLSGTRVMTGAE